MKDTLIMTERNSMLYAPEPIVTAVIADLIFQVAFRLVRGSKPEATNSVAGANVGVGLS